MLRSGLWGGGISGVGEERRGGDKRRMENQIRLQGRRKDARRRFWGMVIYNLREILITLNDLERLGGKGKMKEAGARYFRRIGMPDLCLGEDRKV